MVVFFANVIILLSSVTYSCPLGNQYYSLDIVHNHLKTVSGPIPVVFWYIDFMTSMELSDRLFRSRLGFQSVFDAW